MKFYGKKRRKQRQEEAKARLQLSLDEKIFQLGQLLSLRESTYQGVLSTPEHKRSIRGTKIFNAHLRRTRRLKALLKKHNESGDSR